MTPVELSRTVLRAVRRAVDVGELSVTVPERAVVAPPGPGGCGDYATGIALQLARPAGRSPRQVAEILRPYLLDADGLADVVITGPGFLNIRLDLVSSAGLVEEILRRGERYGYADAPTGQVVQLHAAHEVRAVVVADAVARLLRSRGALARTTCEARPDAAWESVLGARADAYGSTAYGSTAHGSTAYGSTAYGSTAHGSTAHGTTAYGSTAPGTPESHSGSPPVTPSPLGITLITLRPVPAAPADPLPLGRDAGRWALLHPAAHDRPRIGGEHLVQRESNPLFRVRYAHARTRALRRNAADLGFDAEPGDVRADVPATLAADADATPADADATPSVTALVALLADHPRILTAAAQHHAPDRLARHLVAVADAVAPLLAIVLPRGEEKPSAAHRARLALAEAAGTVLAGGLALLGIDAPDHL